MSFTVAAVTAEPTLRKAASTSNLPTNNTPSPTPSGKMPTRTATIPFSRIMSSVDYKAMHFVVFDCPSESVLPLYVEELKTRNVTDVVRVCEPSYDKTVLEAEGIRVHDWPFADGSIPPTNIVMAFLQLCDERFTGGISGAASQPDGEPDVCIGIHCVAGLGRAPVLVAMALIEAGMTPLDAVELVRRRRRGAFNTIQLSHLVDGYKRMWKKPTSKFFSSGTGNGGRRASSPTFSKKSGVVVVAEEGDAQQKELKSKVSFLKVFGGFASGRKSTTTSHA
ncbi:Protein tyrosine phosphatase prl-1 [Phlyctochytrium planicorne]|nr:Protein tyrosine phosphatase prl-1 [Phlyctochytrium planicorne]